MMPKSPGLKYREDEYATLKEAADMGSTQAKSRIGAAQRALLRQRNVARGLPALSIKNKIGHAMRGRVAP